MSSETPLIAIKPRTTQCSFIKNTQIRSSFCGVTTDIRTIAINRKSWSGDPDTNQELLTPELETFKGVTSTGTFPRNRVKLNKTRGPGLLTPNGNSSEVRWCGWDKGRRYAELGFWNKRSPHLDSSARKKSNIVRASCSSDSENFQDDRSTEDDEQSLLKRRTRQKKSKDEAAVVNSSINSMKAKEFFERLAKENADESSLEYNRSVRSQIRTHHPLDLEDGSLNQSQESVDSDGMRGDCSSVDSSGSDETIPCEISIQERIQRSVPIWYLPGLHRAGAFHLLQGKEEGNFIVRQSSQPNTMAISVRLPLDKGPYIEHYLIQANDEGKMGLETSINKFDSVPDLILHYAQCCDELPVQLNLPRALRECKSRHQLNTLTLLGQEFWCYKSTEIHKNIEANQPIRTPSEFDMSIGSFENISNRNKTRDSETNLSNSSLENNNRKQELSTFKSNSNTNSMKRAQRPTPPTTLNLSSTVHNNAQNIQQSPNQSINSLKISPPPPPPRWTKLPITQKPTSELDLTTPNNNSKIQHNGVSVTTTVTLSVNETLVKNQRVDEITKKDFQVKITGRSNEHQDENIKKMKHRLTPEGASMENISNKKTDVSTELERLDSPDIFSTSKSYSIAQVTSPNGSNSITSGIFSPTSQISSPVSNETYSTKSFISPEDISKSELCSPISSIGIFSPSELICSPVMRKDAPLSSTLNSTNRSRRSKRSLKKEIKHYQETDIINSPEIYYRSSLQDKISDYEDIWGTESNNMGCSTFKPNKQDTDTTNNRGIMKSKRPDLLPDTLPKYKTSDSHQSILDKSSGFESNDSLEKKHENQPFQNIVTREISKFEGAPRRPDKLFIKKNANKQMDDEIEAAKLGKENIDISREINVSPVCAEKHSSPFYSEPVDSVNQAPSIANIPRRKLIRVGMNIAQRYSEPPKNSWPYFPLRDMYSVEELSCNSVNDTTSIDNLIPIRTKIPLEQAKSIKEEKTWQVDAAWEFIGKRGETSTFPHLDEHECKVGEQSKTLTLHYLLSVKYPDLGLPPEPKVLSDEIPSTRASCYDNVAKALEEQASDDGTVFSEPWDSSKWESYVHGNHHDDDVGVRNRLVKAPASTISGNNSTVGGSIRSYALQLARDESTIFAHAIKNFISCTLDPKEKSPQVMMRNMRQFMSGMKNYLVKHGERMFEEEVEKERQKLKATEFLNLDAILEEVMVQLVIKPLKTQLYGLLVEQSPPLNFPINLTPQCVGLKHQNQIPPPQVMHSISKQFVQMQETDSPMEKLDCLAAILSLILQSTTCRGGEDSARCMAWCAWRCGARALQLEADVAWALAPRSAFCGPRGTALGAVQAAIALLHPTKGPRVLYPDESRGRLRLLRPPATSSASALARAAAAHAAIPDPQYYSLYLLTLQCGHINETLISDNDNLDELFQKNANKKCVLAYKRIDAKIAWPCEVFDFDDQPNILSFNQLNE